jgi:ectoine hydroxylase-related dioxygenase (phytanoyl-CoA dioxygenase family)
MARSLTTRGGVYAIMPHERSRPRRRLSAHVDSSLESRERVSLVGLIDDVLPGGGAFGVWPGSHRSCWNLLRPASHPLHQSNKSPEAQAARAKLKAFTPYNDQMLAELERIHHEVVPVDCHGKAGDVVFYHSRLGHHAGQNYGENIRQAVLTRLSKTSVPDCDLEQTNDVWLGWSHRVQAAAAMQSSSSSSSSKL